MKFLAQLTKSTSLLSQPRVSKRPRSSLATNSLSAVTSYSPSRSSYLSQSLPLVHRSQSAQVVPEVAVEGQSVAVVVVVSPEEDQEEGVASALVGAVVAVSLVAAVVDSQGERREDEVVLVEEGVKVDKLQEWESGVLVTGLFRVSVYKSHSYHRELAYIKSNCIIERTDWKGYQWL